MAVLKPYRTSELRPGLHMHANESPYPPPPEVMEELTAEVAKLELNRYPDGSVTELRAALADYAGVTSDQVWTGTGSNEVLLQICLAFGGFGRTAIIFPPTYSMERYQAIIAGTTLREVPRQGDLSVPDDDLDADLVFVCTPNNPTGTVTSIEQLQDMSARTRGLLIVDEAYYEFHGRTVVGLGLPNVIAVRTLSKAFRLAGARVGYCIAPPELLEPLAKVKMPYANSALSMLAGTVALRHREAMLVHVPLLIAERERVFASLSAMGVDCVPGAANFVMFQGSYFEALAQRGVVVRAFDDLGATRVTIGSPEQNDAFLNAMSEICS